MSRPFSRAFFGALVLAVLSGFGVSAQEKASKNPEQEGLPLEVGRHLRYTASEGSWMSVDVSPDGRTLVFDHLGDLFTVPLEGGAATRLTRGMGFDTQPRFSPDGRHVLFTSDRDGGENLWIIATDLSDTVQVTKGKHDRYVSPEWTPDVGALLDTNSTERVSVRARLASCFVGAFRDTLVLGIDQVRAHEPDSPGEYPARSNNPKGALVARPSLPAPG